jgi:hypothetical protein
VIADEEGLDFDKLVAKRNMPKGKVKPPKVSWEDGDEVSDDDIPF